MKNFIGLFFILFLFGQSAFAQSGIKGHIRNADNEPLAYTTIFIQQTGTGTVTNDEGYYEVALPAGTYSIAFQFLGYNTLVKKVTVGNSSFKTEDIVLESQLLSLKTVEIFEGREDPAYTIVRKAIAKADYHRQQVERYTARVYVKGSGRIKSIPWLLRGQLKKEGVDTSSAFLVESVNEIEFQRPDKLVEKVISIRSQGEDNGVNAAPYINGSFYRPEVAGAVSPLSPRAFAYYRFELEGSYVDRGYEINKIKVIPRNRGEGVFEGSIYILEDSWSIHSLDLATYKLGFRAELNQIYAPIRPTGGESDGEVKTDVWMPVTHRINIGGKAMGFDFEYKYLATTSDYKIEINPVLKVEPVIIDETVDKEMAAALAEKKKAKKQPSDPEQKLQSGEELTRKDFRKMMKQYAKEDRKKRKEEADEPIVESNRTFETDSTADNRDSAFWAEIRPIPLTKYEIRGYRKADSLAVVALEKKEKKAKRDSARSGGNFIAAFFQTVAVGNTFDLSKKVSLRFGSVLQQTNFNLVEGWNTSIPMSLRFKVGKNRRFSISPTYNIAFSPLVQDGNLDLALTGGKPFRKSKIGLEGGQSIFQFNPQNPVNLTLEETGQILFYERSYARLFYKKYYGAFGEKQVSDYLSFKTDIQYADRTPLPSRENLKSWIEYENRTLPTNIPQNIEINSEEMTRSEIVNFRIGAKWIPFQKYRIFNGKKMLSRNAGPTFNFAFRKGMSLSSFDAKSNYDFVKLGIDWDYELPAGTELRFRAKAGKFLTKENLAFPDYHHFRGNRTFIVLEEPVGNFRLMPYYKYSTGDQFFEFHVHSQLRQFALTQIPELWMLGLKENLFGSYMTTPDAGHYLEVGYGLDNLYKIFRLEFVSSFVNGKFDDFSVRIGISTSFSIF